MDQPRFKGEDEAPADDPDRWCPECDEHHHHHHHHECDCEECLAHHHECDCDDCHEHHHEHHDVERIAKCVRELECTIREVLECLEVPPHTRHELGAFICILLEEIEEIEKLLKNRCFGLREIKNEVHFIENEVILINNTVNNPVVGLNEIKNEIRFVENEVILINNSVNSPLIGLNEIKNELRFVENEVILINNTVNNPVFGLNEIKNEIRLIENQVFNISVFCPNVTSGSIFVENPQTRRVVVAVKNRNTTPRTVQIRVLRDDVCPANVVSNNNLLIMGCCKNEITAPINTAAEYEIEVFGLVPGMTVSSVELNAGGNPVAGTRLTASQFICLTGNCPL